MNTNNNLNYPDRTQLSRSSAFCSSGCNHSNDMRDAILADNERTMASAIQESIDRTFGKISREEPKGSDEEIYKFKRIY